MNRKMELAELILIDKPYGWTSFDVVAKIRNTFTRCHAKRKIGHCGTLDPLATGLLILATGTMTKQISSLELLDKEYIGTIKLGAKTKSYDSETEEYDLKDVSKLTQAEILDAVKSFIGLQMQQAPMFSATWHNGQRLYELARKGEEIDSRKIKEIEVFEFEINRIELPEVDFRIRVSKGTYIRTIAYDLGERLGVGAFLKSLRRTKIGNYDIKDAKSVQEMIDEIELTYLNRIEAVV